MPRQPAPAEGSFEHWLLARADEVGPIADLALDWRDDRTHPEHLTHEYLYECNACDGAHDALEAAIVEWCGPPTLSWVADDGRPNYRVPCPRCESPYLRIERVLVGELDVDVILCCTDCGARPLHFGISERKGVGPHRGFVVVLTD